jgi:DNA polymerase III delta prime subunit
MEMKKEKLQHITKHNVLQAIERIKEEGVPSARESNTYDLVYEGVVYPPKYITSLAGYFSEKGQFIFASIFDGGEESFCFAKLRELGFEILPKAETKEFTKPKEADRKMHYKYTYRVIDEKLDQVLFKEHFTEYIRYCRESSWLTLAEGYKFRFGRWMAENIDLETQKDEEVLAKCNESQEQTYDLEGKAKGINFIVAQKRYQDEFISLIDIQNIRRLKNGELLNDYDLKESPMSFPKFSTWAGILLPEEQMLFGSEELTLGIAHLFHLDDYPKSGVRAFNLANTCLKEIKASILNDFLEESKELINTIFPGSTIQPVDMVWLVQDFILFLNRRVLKFKPEYYWVNQGDNYKAELEHGIVAAPNHKLHHHDRLRHLNEGDKIIHYANKAIRAISTVTKEFVLKPRPYLVDGDADLIVEVDYQVLENPILSEQVKAKFKDKEKLLPKKYGPLTKDLGVVQMYMCVFNEVSYNELFNVPNYWVFQGSPKIFDTVKAIEDNALETWSVHAHKTKIKVGDKVILWITGDQSGCYALAEVTSELFHSPEISNERKYYAKNPENDITSDKVKIKITHDLTKRPVLKTDMKINSVFNNFKGGNQGTNFSATESEYNALLNWDKMKNTQYWLYSPGEDAHKWEEFYNDGIMGLGWDKIGDLKQYNTRDEIKNALLNSYGGKGSKKNDTLANDDFLNKINIGDVVFVKKGRDELLGYGVVSSNYEYDKNRAEYQKVRQIEWKRKGSWPVNFSLVLKTLTDITKYYSDETKTMTYYDELFNIINQKTNNNLKNMESAKNTILYGPPGTGKTFALKQDYFPLYRTKETSISAEKNFESVVKSCSWWEVIAVALIQLGDSKVKDIYNHKWVQKKEELSNSKTVKPTIWGQLQGHTIDECEFVNVKSRQQPLIFNKSINSRWNIVAEEVENQIPELYDLIDKVENFIPDANKTIERYKFVTFHQSYSYEDFIEGIKPVMTEDDITQELGYKIEDGVFKALCEEARNDPGNKYAIFIDEINRGNVSAIFGELITLIEQDKRKGEANEISVQLPYSKALFSVPANIDIYGTMNTADRSVEALDTALRRRFSFVEMMPDVSLLKSNEIDDINLKDVLSTINDRIEILIDRDHTIGHSYFMNINNSKELKLAFKDKIVPLLQEYFYGDYGKIGLVLGEGFVKSHSKSKNPFAGFKYEGKEELNRDFYDLVAIDDTFDIINALENLLNKNKDNQD